MDSALQQRIEGIIQQHPVVVFMKGTKAFPQCGFSATVVEVLNRLGTEFETVNVLEDPEIRQGIKDFSEWPTVPQLYVQGKFVGGCDIVRDLFTSGELASLVKATEPTD
ncbi:MAG: Grx4 family monothiol glutaredoxin [Myxococcales bacterium]|nr:Grx4 family monothiol glutaredoxin [Myxococcales bacterium]